MSRAILHATFLILLILSGTGTAETTQTLQLVRRAPDPNGSPRPAQGAEHVPLETSLYFELTGLASDADPDEVAQSLQVRLLPESGTAIPLIDSGREFQAGARGWIRPKPVNSFNGQERTDLAVYIELPRPLFPLTKYQLEVLSHQERDADSVAEWSFQTEAPPRTESVEFHYDFSTPPVTWRGHFFSGFCNVVFCTQESYLPTYDMMAATHAEHPHAWSYQRDVWLTSTNDDAPAWSILMDRGAPQIVRERETRRITKIEQDADVTVLHVEDFFGHEQYGIASNRPLSADYHSGDEVLIADGLHDARSVVEAVNDEAWTVRVRTIKAPEQGWRIEYLNPLPQESDPDAPGLFATGGCYLRKFSPHGTPCYFWKRLDKEYDLNVRAGGRRVVVDFMGAFTDLSVDGGGFTTAKDLTEWHSVVRTITAHLIERYGQRTLDFRWSVFNEPDLMGLFWRSDWDELQRFYDYTIDGVLRAFEDAGYDSDQVMVGGLELAAIFGTHLKLNEFLAHCSPTYQAKGALEKNAAVADQRLDGQRSRRVEELARQHDGEGSPCDFISIHAYNRSAMMAEKLIQAKKMALAADPEFFKDLWINSHESCPDWSPPPDEAAADVYRGNGYFPSWCLDIVGRQLSQARQDPRYAFGETVITVWPPPHNLDGINAFTRILHRDTDGDHVTDDQVTVPSPIFHVLTMLSDFGPEYWPVSARTIGGHHLSGIAARDEQGTVRLALCAHHPGDTQSRSNADFQATLTLRGLNQATSWQATEYRFDREHNSYFELARQWLAEQHGDTRSARENLQPLIEKLSSRDESVQREAIQTLRTLSVQELKTVVPDILQLAPEIKHDEIRRSLEETLRGMIGSAGGLTQPLSNNLVTRLIERSRQRATNQWELNSANNELELVVPVSGNGVTFVVLRPTVK